MTDEKKKALLSVLDGMDVSEVISLLIMSGNSYSRRLLKFIKWITKWLPICIMVWHSFAMLDLVMSCMSVIVMTGVFYLYWVIDWFLTRTRIGKRFFF